MIKNFKRKGGGVVMQERRLTIDEILLTACRFSRPRWCEAALMAGAHPNGKDWALRLSYWQIETFPICEAIRAHSEECIRLLVKWGAYLDVIHGLQKDKPMCVALDTKNYRIIELLLQLGADPHGCGGRGMWVNRAALVSSDVVELFLDYGANSCDIDPANRPLVAEMLERRSRFKRLALTLYGILRKRYRVPLPGFAGTGGYPLPKELVNQMALWIWWAERKRIKE